jgi:hypothetical protein
LALFKNMKNHTQLKTALTLVLALLVGGVALGMAAVSAWQRGSTDVERVMLVALACACVGAVHLLPALAPRRILWPLWAGCFLLTVFGHAGFFAFAATKAGEARAGQSAQALAIRAQQARITETLSGIKARPMSQVAAQLSRPVHDDKRRALEIELSEARRAATLHDELLRLEAMTASNAGVTDPVITHFSEVTGANEDAITLVLNLGAAAILEVLGVVLWLEVLKPREFTGASKQSEIAPQSLPSLQDAPVDRLRAAITAGQCKPTVASIRGFLGCSQATAMRLRREIAVVSCSV